MTPYYADDWLTVYHGDNRAVLADLPAESVHCVVTSPPYWGLRDYGTARWEGGDEACDHGPSAPSRATRPSSGLTGGKATVDAGTVTKGNCGRCGAIRVDAQLGLEPTPEAYVANMVAVFREVRRVLRDDGTLWLNLGDSYASQGGLHDDRDDNQPGVGARRAWRDGSGRADGIVDERGQRNRNGNRVPGLKPKDLVGIPWRVAFALQADGWYLRSDIIWAKPNPMPESVTDRPTKAHEYLFLLSKSRTYFYDAEAVAEVAGYAGEELGIMRGDKSRAVAMGRTPSGNELAAVQRRESRKRGEFDGKTNALPGREAFRAIRETRNLRTVWTVATQPYPGAHFATFPPKLVEPCIKAGCPAGGVVLDPFAGSGTTGMVAQSLSRRAVLIDLSLDYLGQLMERNQQAPLGLGA